MRTEKSAREHLQDTRYILALWAFIGLVVCFWIAVANNFGWICSAVRNWL